MLVLLWTLLILWFALSQHSMAVDFSKLRDRSMLYPKLIGLGSSSSQGYFGTRAKSEVPQERIVGGHVAPKDKYNSIVAVVIDWANFCGGNIINERWILTAAHCTENAKEFSVIAGEYNLETADAHEQVRKSRRHIEHPDWDADRMTADIALIKVDKLELTDWAVPVNLATNESWLQTQAVGWGQTSASAEGVSALLRYADMTVVSDEVANRTYGDVIDWDSVVCADGFLWEGPCLGDSGGPLYVTPSTTMLLGVTSFVSFQACQTGKPVCFTSVPKYRNWIIATSGANDKHSVNFIIGGLIGIVTVAMGILQL